ncbi:uncharacterized protein LOC144425883 [Styela clava]
MASSVTRQNPPKFKDDIPYSAWRNKVEMWQMVTPIDSKEQAIVVVLRLSSLEGNQRAEKAASELTAGQLHSNDGMTTLLESLDRVFKSDKVDDAYTAFNSFNKSFNMDMKDYIIEFEHLYHKISEFDMKLPDAILTFKILDGANLSQSERQLALTVASDLKFEGMKSALKRVFTKTSDGGVTDDSVPASIKEEAFVSKLTHYRQRKSIQRQQGRKNTMNPLNKFGQVSRCAICDSKMHWANKCPHNRNKVNMAEGEIGSFSDKETEDEVVNFVFMIKSSDCEALICETVGSAIIDTACTKTVCGQKWLNNYIARLPENLRKTVEFSQGGTGFKFGDGRRVMSTQSVIIPARVAGKNCQIRTEVVEDNIPLLLSKSSLKRAGTVLDMENDVVTIFGITVDLQFTESGHYCIAITPQKMCKTYDESVLVLKDMTINDQKVAIKKLHKQFGHASEENMKRLLGNANITNNKLSDIVQDVVKKCETCSVLKKSPPRPAVGLPRASRFIESVAIDLHQLESNLWYMHMVDEFTRFSNAVIVRSKSSSIIANKFLLRWISIFGSPQKVFTDNGREFNNHEFLDMCDNFNIIVNTSPAYSPWSNGVCERHNQVLTNMLHKIRNDVRTDWGVSIAWAVSAKNSLMNNKGFSPAQLVFGQNVNLPSVLVNELPALEGKTESLEVGQHISALHAARRAFIACESSERIQRALRKQTRQSSFNFTTGDRVYYKRPDSHKWRGPGKVIGQDGVMVFVRHGGQVIRVHTCRLHLINSSDGENSPMQLKPEDAEYSNSDIKTEENISDIEEFETEPEAMNDDSPDHRTDLTDSEQI